MNNAEVINSFVRRMNGATEHLTSRNGKLFSYSTCIAQYDSGNLIVNKTKYSSTTSRHLSMLLKYKDRLPNIVEVNNIPIAEKDLRGYATY